MVKSKRVLAYELTLPVHNFLSAASLKMWPAAVTARLHVNHLNDMPVGALARENRSVQCYLPPWNNLYSSGQNPEELYDQMYSAANIFTMMVKLWPLPNIAMLTLCKDPKCSCIGSLVVIIHRRFCLAARSAGAIQLVYSLN